MGEDWDPESVRQLLNSSLEQFDPPTLDQLRAARMHALSRHSVRNIVSPMFAWRGRHVLWNEPIHRHISHHWIGGILLAACLFTGMTYWQHATDSDTDDVDIAILTDDLPLQYYLE